VFISFRKLHVIGQNVYMWLQNWKFISQWIAQPAHFQELFLNVMKTN